MSQWKEATSLSALRLKVPDELGLEVSRAHSHRRVSVHIKFTQSYPLTIHLRMDRQDRPKLCSTCGRSYSCEFCKKRFATTCSLMQHRRSHTGERPNPGSQCDKMFSSCTGLKKHMFIHTGEKPHSCVTCHKTFAQKSNLKIHLKFHKSATDRTIFSRTGL